MNKKFQKLPYKTLLFKCGNYLYVIIIWYLHGSENTTFIMFPFEEVGVYCFALIGKSAGRLRRSVGRSVDKPCPINN